MKATDNVIDRTKSLGNHYYLFDRTIMYHDIKMPLIVLFLISLNHIYSMILLFLFHQDSLIILFNINLILYYINCILLFRCVFVEPGIVPRLCKPIDIYYELEIDYCYLCKHIRTDTNTKHCRSCNCCIEGFDHHCPWIGNCVGKRNYTVFILFLVFLSITTSYHIIQAFVYLQNFQYHLTHNNVTLILDVIFCYIFAMWSTISFICVTSLLLFHIYLILSNQTTYKFIKNRQNNNSIDDNNNTRINNNNDHHEPYCCPHTRLHKLYEPADIEKDDEDALNDINRVLHSIIKK